MTCPLCDNQSSFPARIGPTLYRGKQFKYLECNVCGSIYVSPMPDPDDLAEMYGDAYGKFLSADSAHSGDIGTKSVLDQVSLKPAGVFLDYGCGSARLLRSVSSLGWKAFGVEFDRQFTEDLKSFDDVSIANSLGAIPSELNFDIIHFGDVLEHLTDVNEDFPAILKRLKPGGCVIAQGPLEANSNLFLWAINFKNLLRPSILTEPPYHVSLATRKGQQLLFSRFGLNEEIFHVFETAHPAPKHLTFGALRNPRTTSLFLLRKMSQALTTVVGRNMGNRYFYVGKKAEVTE